MERVKERRPDRDRRGPLVLEPLSHATDLADLIGSNTAALNETLLEHGAIRFHGFSVGTVDDFDRVVAALTEHRLSYTYRSTPRTALGKGIYTATEYPPAREIPLHSESSYQREWPLKMALCCLTRASS